MPLAPGPQAFPVQLLDHGEQASEEQPAGRMLRVDQGEDRRCRRGGLTDLELHGVLGTGPRVVGRLGAAARSPVEPVGRVRSGLDAGDVDTEPLDLLPQRFGKAFERPLRGVVGTDAGVGAHAALAGHLHQVAAALAPQDGQHRLRDPHRAEEVGLHLLPQFAFREFLDHAEVAVARVVDDDVDAPEVLGRAVDRREDALPVGDVEPQRQHGAGEAFLQVPQLFGVAGGGDDAVTPFQRGLRPQATEAGRRSGDEPDFAHEPSLGAGPACHQRKSINTGIPPWHTEFVLDVHPQLLRALRAVVETGSLTAASERLGFTQSALSKQIAALEAATGTRLFDRGPRGVEPTAAGSRLAVRASVILDQYEVAHRELEDLPAPLGGRIALGGFPTTALRLVPRAIARVRAGHPSVEVEFLESSTPVQIRRLRAGRVDLAILASGEDLPDWDLTGVEVEPLLSGALLLAVGRGHRLAGARRVPVAELAGEGWVVGRGARGEPQFGAWPTVPRPRVVAELGDWSARFGFVAAGLGITTIPGLAASALPDGVVCVEVDDPGWAGRSMGLAWIGSLTAAAAAVRGALVEEARLIAERR
nr:LysR transcriptional regulator [uncultured bacterium]